MPIRIHSSIYENEAPSTPTFNKMQSVRYTIAGSADYVGLSAIATAFEYDLLVSASASALGGGVSAGGLDSLRASFTSITALQFVTDEAVTATGWLTELSVQTRHNPTTYTMKVKIVRAD